MSVSEQQLSLILKSKSFFSECSVSNKEKLTSGNIKCYIPPNCNAIQCCHEVDLLITPMETQLSIDPCNFELKVRIEKLEFKIPFYKYDWSKCVCYYIKGEVLCCVVTMVFIIFSYILTIRYNGGGGGLEFQQI